MSNKVLVIGLCGQSGSGKTTIVDILAGNELGGRTIVPLPDGIKSVYATDNILTPDEAISMYGDAPQVCYSMYIKSQERLIEGYNARVEKEIARLDKLPGEYVILSDRSFIDFYLYSKSALAYIERVIGEAMGTESYEAMTTLRENVTALQTRTYNGVVTIYPHGGDVRGECTGAREIGLNPEFTDNNWYGSIGDIIYAGVYDCKSRDVIARVTSVRSAIKIASTICEARSK